MSSPVDRPNLQDYRYLQGHLERIYLESQREEFQVAVRNAAMALKCPPFNDNVVEYVPVPRTQSSPIIRGSVTISTEDQLPKEIFDKAVTNNPFTGFD